MFVYMHDALNSARHGHVTKRSFVQFRMRIETLFADLNSLVFLEETCILLEESRNTIASFAK